MEIKGIVEESNEIAEKYNLKLVEIDRTEIRNGIENGLK